MSAQEQHLGVESSPHRDEILCSQSGFSVFLALFRGFGGNGGPGGFVIGDGAFGAALGRSGTLA